MLSDQIEQHRAEFVATQVPIHCWPNFLMLVAGHPFQALILCLETDQKPIVGVGRACTFSDCAQLHQLNIGESRLFLYGRHEDRGVILKQIFFFCRVDIEIHMQLNPRVGGNGWNRGGKGGRGEGCESFSTIHLKILHQFADRQQETGIAATGRERESYGTYKSRPLLQGLLSL